MSDAAQGFAFGLMSVGVGVVLVVSVVVFSVWLVERKDSE